MIILEGQNLQTTANRIALEARNERVPYSRIAIDETGIGAGVVDMLPGTKGFVAAARPLDDKKGIKENFMNLTTQCTFRMARLISDHKVSIRCDGPSGEDLLPQKVRQQIIEEIEQWKAIDTDKDGKLRIRPKDEVKEVIARSPDLGDMIKMRAFFEYPLASTSNTTSQHNPHLGSPRQSNLGLIKNVTNNQQNAPRRYGLRPGGGSMRP